MIEKRGTDSPVEPGAGDGSQNRDMDSLEARRQRLDVELAARRSMETRQSRQSGNQQGFALAIKLSSEFIAGVIVGAFLGYLFDRFVGTAPWGMIIFLLLGFCAGVLNVLRSIGAVAGPHPSGRPDDQVGTQDDK